MVFWLLLASLTAFFESLKDVFGKKGGKIADEYVVSWSMSFFALPMLIVAVFLTGIPIIGKDFLSAIMIAGPLNVITIVMYMKAIRHSDLSITAPMITFTPAFMLITSPIIVNELPSYTGILGILLIVFGSYMLNIKYMKTGISKPFKALLKETGPRLMLLVAVIWSITANFDKVGVINSSPFFWAMTLSLFCALCMTPIVFSKKNNIGIVKSNLKTLIPIGIFGSLRAMLQMTALTMALAAYVISIKRTSAILGVFWGYFIFKEKGIKERLLGALIMLAGVLLIALS